MRVVTPLLRSFTCLYTCDFVCIRLTFQSLFGCVDRGKPFVDDLIIEPNGSAFEVRSSSRIGDSDLGVNGKRLAYIGNILKGKGWSI